MSNNIANLVELLGSRTNPEVGFADVIDFLVKKYNVNPHEIVNDIKNEKLTKAKTCVHRLKKDDNLVKCIVCDIKYHCTTCENLMLILPSGQRPHKNTNNDQTNQCNYHHYITLGQCNECERRVEYYVCVQKN